MSNSPDNGRWLTDPNHGPSQTYNENPFKGVRRITLGIGEWRYKSSGSGNGNGGRSNGDCWLVRVLESGIVPIEWIVTAFEIFVGGITARQR